MDSSSRLPFPDAPEGAFFLLGDLVFVKTSESTASLVSDVEIHDLDQIVWADQVIEVLPLIDEE